MNLVLLVLIHSSHNFSKFLLTIPQFNTVKIRVLFLVYSLRYITLFSNISTHMANNGVVLAHPYRKSIHCGTIKFLIQQKNAKNWLKQVCINPLAYTGLPKELQSQYNFMQHNFWQTWQTILTHAQRVELETCEMSINPLNPSSP